jgi:endonuclease/exonuclease/phosphatase family metal-dependent hydrolase
MKLSVLQWNVLYTEKGDNVLKLIKEINADIVCLQELTQSSVVNPNRDLAAEIATLGYYFHYASTGNSPELIIGNGIFSKFPIESSKTINLTHEDPSNKDFPQYERAYLESVLNLGETQLTVGVAHLSYSPRFYFFPAKEAEANKFIDLVKPNKSRYIVMGDFNSTPDSMLISELDKIFISAGPSYGEASWTTKPFKLHGFSANTLDWRLDYIYTSKDIDTIASRLVKTSYSDHLPIYAEIDV